MKLVISLLALSLAGTALAQSDGNTWKVERQTSGSAGQQTVSALVAGETSKQGVAVRCKDGRLDVIIGFSKHLGDTPPVRVTYRFDQRDYQYEEWGLSVKGHLAFSPDPRGLARQLARRSTFSVEVLNENGYPHQATFPLRGSAKAIKEVLRACPDLER